MNEMASMTGTVERPTPMMTQFLEIKAAHPGFLLFYRMGDFYELFFEDAETASRALGIALTKRGKHLGADIPMCGVPVHAADQYLQKLIRLEHKVAVCEQMEDPQEAKKRGAKSVVRRNVVRLVTPGTLTEDTLLESRTSNYVAALAVTRGTQEMALAWADISSGEFSVLPTDPKRLAADLARLEPREIVFSDSTLEMILEATGIALSPQPATRFDSTLAEKRLREHFGVLAFDGFGSFSRAEIASLGGLLDYILLTQVGKIPHLRIPRKEEGQSGLQIDMATRANLELTRKLSGERDGSLLSVIDLTVTAAGARLLASRLAQPLSGVAAIEARLDEVSHFEAIPELKDNLRHRLEAIPDLERALGRLTLGRGGPRDLAAVRDGLKCAEAIGDLLNVNDPLNQLPANLATARRVLKILPHHLVQRLDEGLSDALPLLARDGNFVRPGYSQDLDTARTLRDDTRQVIADLQARYAETTGIKNLKIRHNNMTGYFIEVASQHAAILAEAKFESQFIHRQTIANTTRFTTLELSQLEQRIASAAEQALAIEIEAFNGFVETVTQEREKISDIAATLAALDVASSLCELAQRYRYVRPVVDHSRSFKIEGGRHPVVERVLQKRGESAFIANDCDLSAQNHWLWLLTGPNMAGKSTFLRQNALITILAQMGSYVPARSAHIGIVDRLFSRVGAADDLARGRSTFMVEMVETAAILNQATEHSLVILDEIGRGTSTFDGLSIAWATVEHLHETNRCRALFATHYHELTTLAGRLDGLHNATVRVREWKGEVIFLHEVASGVADRSYGIHVAKLAGLPHSVTERATTILTQLEKSDQALKRKTLVDDLPLFSSLQASSNTFSPAKTDEVREMLISARPDELTPRDALAFLYALKAKVTEAQ
ncbi:MAG: DNA mismatch repair protein MutS [Aestuariivirga sp.]